MNKQVVSLAFVLISGSLFAAPVGNPAFPQILQDGYFIASNSWVDLRLGYEGDFVGDGRLKQFDEGSGRIDNFKQDTNSALATLNILDRVDLYGVFGSTRISSDWRYSFLDAVHRIQMETKYHYLWAAGGRALLYEWGNTDLSVGGRYSQTNLKPTWTTLDGEPIATAGTYLHWREWQVDLDLSHKIDIFIPYVGVKYSNAWAKIGTYSTPIASDGSGNLHMKNRSPVGVVVGCTLSTGKYFMLNVEGRLIDEEALSIVGDFRF